MATSAAELVRSRRMAACGLATFGLLGTSWSCAATTAHRQSTAAALREDAAATANARNFTVTLAGAQAVYQAPDRVEQIEHGEASAASASNGGTASTSSQHAETLTKLFIGDRYYESDAPTGQTAPFSVSARCADEPNVAEYVLGILRAIAAGGSVRPSGSGFAFQIPKGGAVPVALSGVATVASGMVHALNLNPGAGTPPSITITAINGSSPVTAPADATPATMSCDTSPSGSNVGSASVGPDPGGP